VRLRRAAALVLVASCAATPAWPQTLLIPDFRQPLAVSTLRPGEPCSDCGRIVSVREVALDRKAGVTQSFQNVSRGPAEQNLVGAVVYLPLSSSAGDRPFVGGVGTPEMRERFGESAYDIMVRMDDGAVRSVRRGDGGRYRVGDRVRLAAAGALEIVVE
jgi:hypothetical protein